MYMAPEIQNRSKPYSNKVDSWSFGIALLQVLSNKFISFLKDNSTASQANFIETHLNKPFAIDYFEKIKNPNQIAALKNRDPEGHFQKIILECLHGDANKRLSMQEIINKLEPIY
jgi:serine/threonine protein kinase